MIRTGHLQEAMRRCEPARVAGSQFWRIDLIESEPQGDRPAPQVFGLEMGRGARLGVHFHFQDQFQVVIKGRGTLGPHRLAPYALHYASGHTGYGPVVASDEEGMTYFTIRAITDGRAHYLPEKRAEMQSRKRRNVHGTYQLPPPGSTRAPGLQPLMPLQDNGAAAWSLSLAPGANYVAEPEGGMRYYFVMDGAITAGDEGISAIGCVFLSDEDRACPLRAGNGGAELLVLQFDAEAAAR